MKECDAPKPILKGKSDCVSPGDANVQRTEVEELDRQGPVAAEVKRDMMDRVDDDISDGDFNVLNKNEQEKSCVALPHQLGSSAYRPREGGA